MKSLGKMSFMIILKVTKKTGFHPLFKTYIYYISDVSGLLQIFDFPLEVMVDSLQKQKGLELVFRPHFL